ncbi:MAG: SPOR domain-containing protein [Bacteroidia bacterium]
MKGYLFVFACLISQLVFAQKSSVIIQRDPQLDSLIQKNIEVNKTQNSMDGFRIQLFSGVERNNANALKTKFLKQYPNVPVYLVYQQPYFKLRAGDFRNKLEAQWLYNQLLKDYGEVLIVPDKINLPKQ